MSPLRVELPALGGICQSLGSSAVCMLLTLFYFREALKIQRSRASKSVVASQTSRNRSGEASAGLLFPDDLPHQ